MIHSHTTFYLLPWRSFNLPDDVKRSVNMWNNEGTVSYLSIVCFVSADDGICCVLHSD